MTTSTLDVNNPFLVERVIFMPKGVYKRKMKTAEELFWKHVQKTPKCWLWQAWTTHDGYGMFKFGGRKGKLLYAHRFSYEFHVGSIKQGLTIDHLCRVRNCVNPEHLEVVTRAENGRRGNEYWMSIKDPTPREKLQCLKCGKEMLITHARIRNSRGRYCSLYCLWNRDRTGDKE